MTAANDDPPVPGQTQAKRRVVYGLNVTVAAAAAVAIVVLINWIGYRHFWRQDLTATRQYSLSPQTTQLLAGLDQPYRIVTLLDQIGLYTGQARDLVDEYASQSKHISVDHINTGRELGRVDALFASLLQRFEPELEPIKQAIQTGRAALDQVKQSAAAVAQPLRNAFQDPLLTNEQLKQDLQTVVQHFARLSDEIDAVGPQLDESLDRPLPRYGRVKDTLQSMLEGLNTKLFGPAADQFEQAANTTGLPSPVADTLLQAVARLKQHNQALQDAVSALQPIDPVEDYDRLVSQLDARGDKVVLIGPDQVRVLGLGEMFREPDPNLIQPGQQPQLQFQGEEKITGVLVSMSLDQPPLVVFIINGRLEATGPNGAYQQVAARLRSVHFEVQQWNPSGQVGPMGQPMPPGPPPQPNPGQKAVWVVLPVEAANPMNPMTAGVKHQIVDTVKKRLEAGDAALIMLQVSPMARFGSPDPMVQLLEPWGITPQLDRLILEQQTLPDHRTLASSRMEIPHWPSALPITRALAGMPGSFFLASPLVLGSGQDGQSVQTWPLAQVQGENIWTHRDLQSDPNPKLDPTTAGGPFVIAAASQRDDNRLVVVADPLWATDRAVTLGPQDLPSELFGVAFPANPELFINSVYWLASLEQLIAASPRSQDIRRVGPISDTGMIALKWGLLGGLPLVILLAGVGVWKTRQDSR